MHMYNYYCFVLSNIDGMGSAASSETGTDSTVWLSKGKVHTFVQGTQCC